MKGESTFIHVQNKTMISLIVIAAVVLFILIMFFSFVPIGLWISAMAAGVHDGDIVSVKADNERGTIFNNVQIRVDDSFTLEMHIDTDEANAAQIKSGDTVRIVSC